MVNQLEKIDAKMEILVDGMYSIANNADKFDEEDLNPLMCMAIGYAESLHNEIADFRKKFAEFSK